MLIWPEFFVITETVFNWCNLWLSRRCLKCKLYWSWCIMMASHSFVCVLKRRIHTRQTKACGVKVFFLNQHLFPISPGTRKLAALTEAPFQESHLTHGRNWFDDFYRTFPLPEERLLSCEMSYLSAVDVMTLRDPPWNIFILCILYDCFSLTTWT